MTTTEKHKAELRMQLRAAISAARKQAGLAKNQHLSGTRAERGRKILKQMEDQIRMLDVIDAIKEGDPLPLGWQDIRLPD